MWIISLKNCYWKKKTFRMHSLLSHQLEWPRTDLPKWIHQGSPRWSTLSNPTQSFLLGYFYGIAKWVNVTQSCPTLWDPMDYTVHGILQARILEWVAMPSSKGSSQPRDWTLVSHIAGGFFTSSATILLKWRSPQGCCLPFLTLLWFRLPCLWLAPAKASGSPFSLPLCVYSTLWLAIVITGP